MACWLEETGYFELDGAMRVLARRLDSRTELALRAVEQVAEQQGRSIERHDRYLNKAFGVQRCPFLTHLAGELPYLAFGPNDPLSQIHAPNESLPVANLALAVEQNRVFFETFGGYS